MTNIPSSTAIHITLLSILSSITLFSLYKALTLQPKGTLQTKGTPQNPNSTKKHKNVTQNTTSLQSKGTPTTLQNKGTLQNPKILYLSKTNTSKTLAKTLLSLIPTFSLIPFSSYEPEDLTNETLVVFIVSSYNDNNDFLCNWLQETENDFRAGNLLLKKVKFTVFGVGSRNYGEKYNFVAKEIFRRMKSLGAVEILGLGLGDVDSGSLDDVFHKWSVRLVKCLSGKLAKNGERFENGENNGVKGQIFENGGEICEKDGIFDNDGEKGEIFENGESEIFENGEESDDFDESEEEEEENGVVDLEDIAGKAPKKKDGVVVKVNGKGPKEMVTPVIRANLVKQGYKILGSHSGVKICRWTKAQLRGRGGCYKHSFYGIESHRCMEATPSLACANKCVFCWRHHTNPVAKSWQWKMDDALDIVNSAIEEHTKMIKQMKGVPGVKPERLTEGLTPRHCALSLVGEPIMYPEINTLVDELHKRRISTFLVTNAQFPDKIKMLNPITQLYVSVDAATKDSLKAIDRPLFSDFWERFLDSLKALQEKQQRTVYRLTLVKGWNAEDLDAYSNLFSVGNPDFIEIKGVTYCGSTATSKLTMENVPWHADVKEFSEALSRKSNGEYEVACEHVHSCCVLLAKVNKFKINGQWFTWIDYEKFHDLVASGKPFDSKDYMAVTPSWAVYGADEGGFDPAQARFKKERHHKPKVIES